MKYEVEFYDGENPFTRFEEECGKIGGKSRDCPLSIFASLSDLYPRQRDGDYLLRMFTSYDNPLCKEAMMLLQGWRDRRDVIDRFFDAYDSSTEAADAFMAATIDVLRGGLYYDCFKFDYDLGQAAALYDAYALTMSYFKKGRLILDFGGGPLIAAVAEALRPDVEVAWAKHDAKDGPFTYAYTCKKSLVGDVENAFEALGDSLRKLQVRAGGKVVDAFDYAPSDWASGESLIDFAADRLNCDKGDVVADLKYRG